MTLVISGRGRCPLCGTPDCGQRTSHTPFDIPTEEAAVGGELQVYDVVYNGNKTQMKLNKADAERLGGTPAGQPAAEEAKPSAAAQEETAVEVAASAEDEQPATEDAAPAEEKPQSERKARTSRNKSRTAQNKNAGG